MLNSSRFEFFSAASWVDLPGQSVVLDQLVYTPLFCVWFLAAFVVLERRDVRTVPAVIRSEWFELYRGIHLLKAPTVFKRGVHLVAWVPRFRPAPTPATHE